MALGEKLWEGRGKSGGAGFIKSVNMEGVTSEYSWMAQLKGMGRASGVDLNVNVTAVSMAPPKGVYVSKDQGIFRTMSGDMGVLKGMDMMKMGAGGKPSSVGLWGFMTLSEKLGWMNGIIAIVTFEAQDPVWEQFNITIYEWA